MRTVEEIVTFDNVTDHVVATAGLDDFLVDFPRHLDRADWVNALKQFADNRSKVEAIDQNAAEHWGDIVLAYALAEAIAKLYPEGDNIKTEAILDVLSSREVQAAVLRQLAKNRELRNKIPRHANDQHALKCLSDFFESFIGLYYQKHSMKDVGKFISDAFKPLIEDAWKAYDDFCAKAPDVLSFNAERHDPRKHDYGRHTCYLENVAKSEPSTSSGVATRRPLADKDVNLGPYKIC